MSEAGEAGDEWVELEEEEVVEEEGRFLRRNAHIEGGPRGSGDEGGARRSAAAAPPATRSCCSFPHTCRHTPLSSLLPSHLAAHLCLRCGLLLAHRPGFVAPTVAARKLASFDQLSGGRVAVHIISGGSDSVSNSSCLQQW